MKILSTKKYSMVRIMNIIQRKQSQKSDVEKIVWDIIQNVRKNKDKALLSLSEKFDGVKLKTFEVSREEILEAYKQESKEVIKALKAAKINIEKFHKNNVKKKETAITTTKGVKVWREFRPIEKIGLYIPGGKAAYSSTVLMLGVPAKIAGCAEIVLCVPPGKDGKIPGVVLVAADICGISKIFKVGGSQAIVAMAYGTESIPKVSKIFGPGNQYVTTAKMLVYGEVDIDMPAGPSEVLVFADITANPAWVAADLLSQLEHGEDSQAILVTESQVLASQVLAEIEKQAKNLSRKEIIKESLQKSFIVVVASEIQACELINEYAPEHLEIISKNERQILEKINNAGSVFLGPYSSEPLGDYATGSNHTLPTSGYAKMFSALSA
ncbi:histidinol dehydrogenase [Candidatus Nomurabacteria bacterium RIFCSPHIGHO2_01_FULL_38_19]|uniref:Histidinol dehydrogenase n=1 Tax=Candidatus Nomurabacteria bacterium RIFCSPHIGHO2_01_FULL_38_19 TaxID=1801732 RepID=A0A1F6URJ6_9BACT|nr:MAG: histidinol dehydrogenase [Candidatus Nomurabacteria bacterium RIFCSPHIGHO2_01_FULL_38_19]